MASIKVEPGEIVFQSAKPGVLYVMTISVRNVTNTAQRIRLQAPKSSIFALNYIPAGVIAPGLDLRAEIECQIPIEMPENVFSDKLVVSMGQNSLEVPIRAVKPFADIRFERSVPLGNVFLHQLLTRDIFFENASDIPGVVKFSLPRGSSLKLSATRLELSPRGTEDARQFVRVSLESKEIGTIREFLKVSVVGSTDDAHIDISAQVIEQQLTLLSENRQGAMDSAAFGTIFFGETRRVVGLLVNGGPLPLSYSMKFEDEDDAAAPPASSNSSSGGASVGPQSSADVEAAYGKCLSVSPVDGTVRPFSSVPITFLFEPTQIIPERGFTQQQLKEHEEPRAISRNVRIDCLELNQSMSVALQGKAQLPLISLTPSVLRFGDCPVNDRRDILLTLVNKTKLPTSFEFPAVATFKFSPMKGAVLGGETVSVVASFLPPQLGKFKSVIAVQVADGLRHYDLKVVGEATQLGGKKTLVAGTDKLPNDFVAHRKFVDPEEEATARKEKRKVNEDKQMRVEADLRTLLLHDAKPGFVIDAKAVPTLETLDAQAPPAIIDASQERDEIYGTDPAIVAERERKSEANMTLQHLQFLQTKQHNKFYNEYLQRAHYDREILQLAKTKKTQLAKGVVDFSDPFGVNLGMERGLEEPVLRVPPAVEPLWMTGGAGAAGGMAKGRLPVDENRLIQKKYSSTPATQAELRDCSTELSVDDLKVISASHKVLDFGRVCVGSSSAKNFVVFNGIKHSILVSIEDLEVELQQSKALTQIIPESCMAGFDIYFSSRVLGKVKKSFTWKVNGFHVYKVHVLAEVVPIDLAMSKTELVMECPVDWLKPTLTTDLILSNPGNAYAEYLWGSVGAFSCDPEKGSIAPGKSAVITVTWDPHAGKRLEEELGLHVSGGVDQVLRVRGVLPETKAEFSERRLALGVMAVGTEREILTHVSNTGDAPLCFFVNAVEDALGISVSPTEGFVPAGESLPVRVRILPRAPRNYDNASITAKVRGGKSIAIRLNGSSIVPQIELEEQHFRFGSVTVGASARMPFTLRNKSPITATLMLDLSSFPDFFPFLLNALEEPDLATKEFGAVSPTQEDELGNQVLLSSNPSTSSAVSARREKKTAENPWRISIPAQSVLRAELVFRPTSARKYQFRLPLYLYGMAEDKVLCREVSGASVSSAVVFSSFVTDFGDRVVSRDALARVSYFLETSITNNGQTGVSFTVREGPEILRAFDGSAIANNAANNGAGSDPTAAAALLGGEKQQIFFVSPLKLDLAPGQTTKLRVTFLPQQNCTYSKKLGLFLKDQTDQSRPYLSLLCVGSGVYPCMSFSTQHVRLPTVPLGITSRASFTLFNHGYASLDIKHRVSPNIPVTLDVSYPDGAQIGIMVDRIRVIIAVKSDAPCAFTGKIEFYDMDGERFFVQVCGAVDNSLLANYAFVRDYGHAEYGFVALDDQPVQFLPQPQIAELRQIEAKRKEELRKQRSLERLRAVEGKNGSGTGGVRDDASAKSGKTLSLSKKESSAALLQRTQSGSTANGGSSSSQLVVFEGVDVDRAPSLSLPLPLDAEAAFLLKWLNAHVATRRPFDAERFPQCVLDSGFDVVVDCLEAMSGKRIQNLVLAERRFGEPSRRAENNSKNGTAAEPAQQTQQGQQQVPPQQSEGAQRRSSEKARQIAAADKAVHKAQQILNFLSSHGALLAHISPLWLLRHDEFLLMQEHDATKDKSVHFTPAMLNARRSAWDGAWRAQCAQGWLEVLYQAVKVFVFSRLTYREFAALPGVVLSTESVGALGGARGGAAGLVQGKSAKGASGKQNGGKHGKDKERVPGNATASNVFTAGENVLLAWLSYHLERADHCVDEGAKGAGGGAQGAERPLSFNRRVADIDTTFRDFFSFCQLMHSHASDITQKGEPLHGYTALDRAKHDLLAASFEDALQQYRCEIPRVACEEILVSSRNLLLMLLHLYLSLPHLVPKAKVDFAGVLGEPIVKKIELRNASKKPLLYEVTLKGSGDFLAESATLAIPAESSAEFLVTLNAHFMHTVRAKLYFWNSRDSPSSNGGATLCFQCVSSLRGMKPVESVQRDTHLFDLETFSLSLRNPFPRDATLRLKLSVRYAARQVTEIVGPRANKRSKNNSSGNGDDNEGFKDVPTVRPPQEELLLLSGAGNSGESGTNGNANAAADDWDIENLIAQPFWLAEESVSIPAGGVRSVKVSLLPFLLGRYVCQIVCVDAEQGEFCYEIQANVGLPKSSDKLELSVLQGSRVNMALTLNSKNAAFEKAYGIATEARIKNANKKIRARGVFQQCMATTAVTAAQGEREKEDSPQSTFCVDFTTNFFSYKRNVPFISEYLKLPQKANQGEGKNIREKDAQNAAKLKKIQKTQLDVLSTVNGDETTPSSPSLSLSQGEGLNKALLVFSPDKAGVYRTTCVVYPEDNPRDVRCVELSLTARVPDAKMAIEFNAPARRRVMQEIPIRNDTDDDWTLSVAVTVGNSGQSGGSSGGSVKDGKESGQSGGGGLFSQQRPFSSLPRKSLVVPRHGAATMQVFFLSPVRGAFTGKLALRNVENNDVFEYALRGAAQDALAEAHHAFSCTARRRASFSIPLPSLRALLGTESDNNSKAEKGEKYDENEVQTYRFQIDSDVPYLHAMKTLELSSSAENALSFSINSPIGGTLTGYIGLRDGENGLVLWYTLSIEVHAPKEEKAISVRAAVRSAVAIGITLDNPLDEEIHFDVAFAGDGLFGENSFSLPPRSKINAISNTANGANNTANSGANSSGGDSATYELVYSPLIAGEFTGRVSFFNASLGELWYRLDLVALPAAPVELEIIESMLGSEGFVDAPVENPSNAQVVYEIDVSDREHFYVTHAKISLAPFMQNTLRVFFRPSSLNEVVCGTVRLWNRTVGEALYAVRGKGMMPGLMPAVTVEGPLNEIVSRSVVFRNPFAHPLPVEVVLDRTTTATAGTASSSSKKNASSSSSAGDAEQGVFSLLLRKSNDIVLAAKTPLHIPVGFTPRHLGVFDTSVTVRAALGAHSLLWCFPVRGIAEMGHVLKLPALRAPGKTSLLREYVLPLSGLRAEDVALDDLRLTDFSILLNIEEDLLAHLVSRSVRIQPLEVVLFAQSMHDAASTSDVVFIDSGSAGGAVVEYGLRCRVLFEPLRVFSTSIDVSIVCKNRGKWKARVDVEATDPAPDDVIKLVASVNSVERVSFKLRNRFLGFSAFQAYFSSNSSPHFSVSPVSGVLPPCSSENAQQQSEGVNFVVTFAPKEYGVVETATLNILTEDAQWTYLLKGSFPDNSYHSGPLKKPSLRK